MIPPFGTPILFSVSMSSAMESAVGSFLDILVGQNLPYYFSNENNLNVSSIEELFYKLDSLNSRDMLNTVCVVDITDSCPQWNINNDNSSLRPTELVLRYPGIYWLFLVHKKPDALNSIPKVQDLHFVTVDTLPYLATLLRRHVAGFRAWFDPTGLRRIVRGDGAPKNYGVSIDDESSFAIMNGYVLYRNRRSVYVISSQEEMDKALREAKETLGDKDWTTMEDIMLNFVDAKGNHSHNEPQDVSDTKEPTSVNEINKRKENFPILSKASRKIVSSALWDKPLEDENKESYVPKPYGGMYAKEFSDIQNKSCDNNASECYKQHAHSVGNARAQYVAGVLIARARRLTDEAKTPEAAVHVALLAYDARRLLKGESLALSLEALAIQHKMEVTAECAFIGTASNLEVKGRFKALENDIKEIIPGINKDSFHQKYNALVEIADDMRQIYRCYDQFLEEEETIKKLRSYEWCLKYWSHNLGLLLARLRTRLGMDFDTTKNKKETPLHIGLRTCLSFIFFGLPELYFNQAVSSLWKMGILIVGWIIIFASIFSWILGPIDDVGFLDWVMQSAANFFAPGSELPKFNDDQLNNGSYLVAKISEMVFSFVHIGIFVSYLFQKISRR